MLLMNPLAVELDSLYEDGSVGALMLWMDEHGYAEQYSRYTNLEDVGESNRLIKRAFRHAFSDYAKRKIESWEKELEALLSPRGYFERIER